VAGRAACLTLRAIEAGVFVPNLLTRSGLRTAYFNQQDYRVLRFWNEQANSELEGVAEAI
jgi:hypothetical protein